MRQYAVIIERVTSRQYSGYVPDLPGCVAHASTREACESALREGIEYRLAGVRDHWGDVRAPVIYAAMLEIPEDNPLHGPQRSPSDDRILIELSEEQIEVAAEWWSRRLEKVYPGPGPGSDEWYERFEFLRMPDQDQLWLFCDVLKNNLRLGLPGGVLPKLKPSHDPQVLRVDHKPDHILEHAFEFSYLPPYLCFASDRTMRFAAGGIWVRDGRDALRKWILAPSRVRDVWRGGAAFVNRFQKRRGSA